MRTPLIFQLLVLCAMANAPMRRAASFERDVAPILQAKCLTCHQAEKSKGKYRLDTFDAMLKPGASDEAAIVPGNAEGSLLFKLLTTSDEDDRMPQKDQPLDPKQIELIRAWIEAGAEFNGVDRHATLAALTVEAHPLPPESYGAPVAIRAMVFGPRGELIVGGYNEVIVRGATNGALLKRITNAPTAIYDLSLSPDEKFIALAGGTPGRGGEVSLHWLDGTAQPIVLGRFPDVALAVAFTPDGEHVVAGGSDNSIHIYKRPDWTTVRTIQQHADWVTDLRVSADSKQIVSASRDKTSRLYDLATGELLTTFPGDSTPIWTSAFRGANNEAISAGRDKAVRFWNLESGNTTKEIENIGGEALDLAVKGNQLFAACSDGVVREFDMAKRVVTRTLPAGGDYIYSLALSSDGTLLAAGGHDGRVRVWRVESGELVTNFFAAPGL